MKINQSEYDLGSGYTKLHRQHISDERICPRCKQRSVDKIMRKCKNCSGVLLWYFDDDSYFEQNHIDYYRWYKSIWGVEGYYHRTYWSDHHNTVKY
jgi:hypothetical protein